MTTLHLFRHGETNWNVEERFQGHTDIPLNDKGREQARALIAKLRDAQIEAILSSDLSRAYETAKIVADALNIPIHQDADLREAHLGHAQGLTWKEIEAKFGREVGVRWRSNHMTDADVRYPGGETGNQVMKRTFDALERFMKAHPEIKTFGVASHGGVIRRIMQRILPPGSPPVPIPNGVLYEIHYSPENTAQPWRLVSEIPKERPWSPRA